MTRRPARLRLAGLLVLLAFVAGAAALALWGPGDRFEADYDASGRARDPAFAQVLDADPALHALMLRETRLAYDKGGWPAATERNDALKWERVLVYAGDAELLACAAEWNRIEQSLARSPADCRAYFSRQLTAPAIQVALAGPHPACDAATRDGGRRRKDGTPPRVLSDGEYQRVFGKLYEQPAPFTDAERAVAQGGPGSDALFCQAKLKFKANQAALPSGDGARFLRTQYQYGALFAANVERDRLQALPPPPALRCPRAGTVFTLSMQAGDTGQPITWASGGQAGWDCVMISSVSGKRRLWDTLDENPLQLLWPLQTGRTADIPAGADGAETHLAVTGFQRYWLASGWAGAYTIDATVSAGGRRLYTTTYYWSPELGWKIGQHTRLWSGSWPDTATPDWQVIAIGQAG